MRSAVVSTSPPAIACPMASSSRSWSAYHRLAARCRPGTRSGVLGGEPRAQRVGEQVVVPVPLPLVVEGDDEQVVPVQPLEHAAARLSSR